MYDNEKPNTHRADEIVPNSHVTSRWTQFSDPSHARGQDKKAQQIYK